MPKLLIDANISYRIKKNLYPVFEDVLHVTDLNLSQPAKDIEIWKWAKANQFLITTFDTDFETLFNFRGFPPKLVLLKIGNQSTKFISKVLISSHEKIVLFDKSKIEGLIEIL